MPFARTPRTSATSGTSEQAQPSAPRPRYRDNRPRRVPFDISLIADLLAAPHGFAAYAGIGSRETPADVLADMTLIAEGLEARGFTLRSGFAGGADTAFELGTSDEALREIFAPWKGFGADPKSKWDQPRWNLIRAWEAKTGRRFQPARAHLLAGPYIAKAEELASQHHAKWHSLPQSAQKLHSRNMGQVLGAKLDTKARFVIAWTSDGQDTGGTGQAIRVAEAFGIPVLNLHDVNVRAEILRILRAVDPSGPKGNRTEQTNSISNSPTATNSAGASSVSYHQGDVSGDTADLIVNTVNCVSVMGKGVALSFKSRFPDIMAPYTQACRSKSLQPGDCMLFPLSDGRQWAALATKNHWRHPSKIEWIKSGLAQLRLKARHAGIRSIAIPAPGCGNGGLDWAEVEPLVLAALTDFEVRIYAPTTMVGAR